MGRAFSLFWGAHTECDNLEFPREEGIQDAAQDRYYEPEEELLAPPAPTVESHFKGNPLD